MAARSACNTAMAERPGALTAEHLVSPYTDRKHGEEQSPSPTNVCKKRPGALTAKQLISPFAYCKHREEQNPSPTNAKQTDYTFSTSCSSMLYSAVMPSKISATPEKTMISGRESVSAIGPNSAIPSG